LIYLDLLLNSAGCVYLGVSLGGYIPPKEKGVFVVNSLEEIKADIKNNVEHGRIVKGNGLRNRSL